MNKQQELDRADRELKDISARIDSIKFHIKSLETNLALLNSVKISFTQNLAVLKDEKVCASLEEYKKIKEDHQTVTNRMYVLHVDLNNHNLVLDRCEKLLFETKERYATLLKNQDAKVIRGSFGKK